LEEKMQQIFIFDILLMKKDEQFKEKAMALLKYLFESPKILKVLHDCRHDSLALHS